MGSFSGHCALLGCPLANVRTSWCSISHDHARAVFTIWADEVKGQRFVLHPIVARRPGAIGNAADGKVGAKELAAVATYVVDNPHVEALGILCTAQDPSVQPRIRKHYDDRTVFKLSVFREGNSIVAQFVKRVPVESLTHIPNHAP